ncbi:MAG: hypothetical protein H0W24_04120 [Lysobacter sp.]|jgi:hypothetical protein|nr:hypothetical protein [Lysobacter sp.]MDQ3269111.1 hypothetical protein [Pseudomonadota bacterium]
MEAKEKLFAFKLVEKQSQSRKDDDRKWEARVGVATAGCSEVDRGNFRCASQWSPDGGAYC